MDSVKIEKIAQQYLDSIYRIALNYCKNAEDAADAVQNAFLALAQTDREFADEEHIHRWLIKVAINECKKNWRIFSRHPIVSLEQVCEEDGVLSDVSPDDADRARELWDAVMRLPAKYSAVLHLYYYEGYSADEISKMMGISVSNVLVRLNRGREMLRKAWKGESES